MTFLAPWFLAAAAAVASGVIALHFLARQRPRIAILPTARFVPDRPAGATGPSSRPSDLLLLAMRVLAVVFAGLAFAQPIRKTARRPLARVVAVDLSRATRSDSDVVARARAMLRESDALVVFDSAARQVRGRILDSARSLRRSEAQGSLSAALIASLRARASLAEHADSVELLLVSPVAAEEWDAATVRIRALWPGRVVLARIPAAIDSGRELPGIDFRGEERDPLRATVALMGAARREGNVRVVRGVSTAEDSAWARQGARVLVEWPSILGRREAAGGTPVDRGWPVRSRKDTIGAVVAGDVAVIAAFERGLSPPPGIVIARWVDGEPAATESSLGAGCVRGVSVPIEDRGDLALRESMTDFVAALSAPCGGRRRFDAIPDPQIALLTGRGVERQRATVEAPRQQRSPAAPWLLAGALLTVAAEPLARRSKARQ